METEQVHLIIRKTLDWGMATCHIQTRSFSSENEVEIVGRFLKGKDLVDCPYFLKRSLSVSFWPVFWKIHSIVDG